MANTFLTVNAIARKALPILQENLVFPALATLDYGDTFAQQGDTIQVKRPAIYTAQEFSTSITEQDINPFPVLVKMDKIADISVVVTAKQMAMDLDAFTEDITMPAIVAIAEKINQDGLDLYKWVGPNVGVSGSTPDALSDFADSRKLLNDAKAPMADRYAVWDPAAEAKFLVLDAIVGADKSGSTQALRDASIGRIFGMDNFMTQAIKTHTAGGYTALADVKATASVASNAVDATTGLTYMSVLLESTAGTSTATLLKGDLIDLEDDSGNAYQVTVIENSAAAVAGDVTVKVFPAITADDLTATDVTFPDVTNRKHVANMVFHKKAFGFVTRPLEPAPGAEYSVESFGGLTIRVVKQYAISTKKTYMSFDVLYGWAPLYPELAVRVLG